MKRSDSTWYRHPPHQGHPRPQPPGPPGARCPPATVRHTGDQADTRGPQLVEAAARAPGLPYHVADVIGEGQLEWAADACITPERFMTHARTPKRVRSPSAESRSRSCRRHGSDARRRPYPCCGRPWSPAPGTVGEGRRGRGRRRGPDQRTGRPGKRGIRTAIPIPAD